ncbi:MAG: Gfo/Idh/MocA family oxidoreductase, partial [Chloroflexota bacterium]|nr:Gfo/Idh/MocA family oxidoreductase [Chloroflexota bacterium]
MADERVGVGIIGTGGISRLHISGILTASSDLARIVAVSDTSAERGQRAAQAAGGAEYHADYRELLARDDVLFVDVLTPPGTHREVAVAAARAGKHVCIIKPFTVHLADADAVISAARDAGVKLFAGQPSRYDPSVEAIAEVFRRGDLGEPVRTYTRSFLDLQWLEKPQNWYYDLDQSGGVTIETLVHSLDLMAWLFGPATRAYAEAGCYYTRDRAGGLPDDQMAALYRFESGAFGVLEGAGARALGAPSSSLELTGTEGVAWRDAQSPGTVHVSRTRASAGSIETVVTSPSGGGVAEARMLRAFLECVRDDTALPVTGVDGRYAVELAWGAISSYQTGNPVSLP